jgi:hypothetical protein
VRPFNFFEQSKFSSFSHSDDVASIIEKKKAGQEIGDAAESVAFGLKYQSGGNYK